MSIIQHNLPQLDVVIETRCGNRAITKAVGLGLSRCGFLLGVDLYHAQSMVLLHHLEKFLKSFKTDYTGRYWEVSHTLSGTPH